MYELIFMIAHCNPLLPWFFLFLSDFFCIFLAIIAAEVNILWPNNILDITPPVHRLLSLKSWYRERNAPGLCQELSGG